MKGFGAFNFISFIAEQFQTQSHTNTKIANAHVHHSTAVGMRAKEEKKTLFCFFIDMVKHEPTLVWVFNGDEET